MPRKLVFMVGNELLIPRLEDKQMYKSSIACRREIPARLLQHAPKRFAGVVVPNPTAITDCIGVCTRSDVTVID